MTRTRVWHVLLATLVLALLGAGLATGAAQDGGPPNLLRNGGFEQGKEHWRTASPDDPFTVVEGEGIAGSRAAALHPPADRAVEVSQLVSLAAGAEYRLTGSVRVRDERATAMLRIVFVTPVEQVETRVVAEDRTQAWQSLDSGWMTPRVGATYARVAMRVEAGTTDMADPVLFDDLTFEERLPPTPTPEPTATPLPPSPVYVNEALSRPATDWNADGAVDESDEWVELYVGGDREFTLEGWTLDDGPDGSEPYDLRETFEVRPGYYVLLAAETRLRLDDAGDAVRLFRPDGTLASRLDVPPLEPDRSVGRVPDGTGPASTAWLPTPLEPNGSRGPAPAPTPEPTPSPTPTGTPEPEPDPDEVTIVEARERNAGDLVAVRGTITAPAHLLGARRLYVQDATGGILVIVPEEFASAAPGGIVEVTGETGAHFGERALRATVEGGRVQAIGRGDPPAPRGIRTAELGAATEGLLVRVEGEVTSANKPGFRLDDGSGEGQVRVGDSTGIPWPSPRKQDTARVTGIVSSFNGGFRLLPRYAGDIALTRHEEPDPTPTPTPTPTPDPDATPAPTPDPEPAPPPLVSIAEARAARADDPVRIRGTVTAPPHRLGSPRLYLQDGTAGILVAAPEDMRPLALGQVVEVAGAPGTYYGERALRDIGEITVVGSRPPPEPRTIRTGEVGPDVEGLLVRLRGAVTEAGEPGFRLDDGSGEARVQIAEETGIRWPSPHRRDRATVVGVVSSFNGHFRVLPRFEADLALERFVETAPEPRDATIREARLAPEGALLRIEGAVTAPPGPLGEGRFWMQDGTGGIPVACSGACPALASGDRVRATGETGAAYGERQLRAEEGAVRRLASGPPPRPRRIPLGEIGAATEGLLVEVEGAVVESAWPSLYLGAGTPPVRVYARDSAGLANPEARRGDRLRATGVVSGYQGTVRVLPFRRDHLLITVRAHAAATDYREATVAAARAAAEGSALAVRGTVTAPDGVLGERVMYVQDATGGILVTGELPATALGDVVRVEGWAGTYYSERRLDAARVVVLGSGSPVPPRAVGSGEIGPTTEGTLVSLSGTVAASAWPRLMVGEPPARVQTRDATGIPNPEAGAGDHAAVTGIVSRHNDAYSLLPRYPSDLSVSHEAGGAGPDEDTSGGENPESNGPDTSAGDGSGPDSGGGEGYDPDTGAGESGSADTGGGEVEAGTRLDVAVAEARQLPPGTLVRVEARVTAPPGVLGEARAYIGDADAGIALHLPGGGYPLLAEGDRVAASGMLDTYHGETIIRLETGADVVWLGGDTPVAPVPVGTGDLSAATEGRLVTASAPITGQQWPAFSLDDGSGEGQVRIMETTGIPNPEGGAGDMALVTGIVSQWDGSFRLLPRFPDDLQISIAATMPRTGGGAVMPRWEHLPVRARIHISGAPSMSGRRFHGPAEGRGPMGRAWSQRCRRPDLPRRAAHE